MSEKRQGTAFNTHKKMQLRYPDDLNHKHNKQHLEHRNHYRTHPVNIPNDIETEALHEQYGMHRTINNNRLKTRRGGGYR